MPDQYPQVVFSYDLDETGDTGADLENVEQPIFVLGGVTVSDKSWRNATDAVQNIITDFFNGAVPNGFELHAHELVAHQGPFAERSQQDCNALTLALLDLLIKLHRTHFVAVDKRLLLEHADGEEHNIIDCKTPYLLTGISAASGQALANAFASSVAWGDEEPMANPAFPMLSVIIGVQLPQRAAWLRLSASASLKTPSIFSFV